MRSLTAANPEGAGSFARPVTALTDAAKRVFQVVFRMVLYPTESRLIRIGHPDRRSPVLVTTDYDLTVRRVCAALRGVDCFLLVAPAGGLDVWCAAGGGRFSISSIISILKTSGIANLVDHRRLILPQLAANGIDVFELKRRTGWTGVFGPVRAEDVPDNLRTRRKTEAMTRITFTPLERMEMGTAMWGSLSLRYTLFPSLVFGWHAAPRFVLSVAVLSLATGLGCFVLPGTTFVQKAGLLGLAATVATLSWLGLSGGWDTALAIEWTVVLLLSAFLVGTAFPSYSPYLAVRLLEAVLRRIGSPAAGRRGAMHRLQDLRSRLPGGVLCAVARSQDAVRRPGGMRGVRGLSPPMSHGGHRQRSRGGADARRRLRLKVNASR